MRRPSASWMRSLKENILSLGNLSMCLLAMTLKLVIPAHVFIYSLFELLQECTSDMLICGSLCKKGCNPIKAVHSLEHFGPCEDRISQTAVLIWAQRSLFSSFIRVLSGQFASSESRKVSVLFLALFSSKELIPQMWFFFFANRLTLWSVWGELYLNCVKASRACTVYLSPFMPVYVS